MNTSSLSIVHRLPQSYRWSAGFAGSRVEPIPPGRQPAEQCLVGLKLLTQNGESAWSILRRLSQALTDISLPCSVLECEGEPCLFVECRDEFAATCRLKNVGVAIAEPIMAEPAKDPSVL